MTQQENSLTGVGIGDKVAPFTLPVYGGGSAGRPSKMAAWRPEKVTVFSLCALWCDTWKEQSARLIRTQKTLAGLPIEFLTVSVDGRWAERFHCGNQAGVVLLDEGSKLSAALGVRAVPYTVVVDGQGIVRWVHQGIVRSEDLVVLLRTLATVGSNLEAAASDKPVAYLTFDDFPTAGPKSPVSDDEELLDILRAAFPSPVRATFFCIGEHLQTSAGMVCARRAVGEGHQLQIHGWSHNAADPQIERCVRLMKQIAPGVSPTLYRPPGKSELRRVGGGAAFLVDAASRLPVVNPYDFARPGEAELLRRLSHAVRPRAVLQLHAGVAQTRNILPALFDSLYRRGFVWDVLR